jgi:hypothetical protein
MPFADVDNNDGLSEIPMAVHPRFRVPIAGGFYTRLLSRQVLQWGIDSLNLQDVPAVLYFHPWEFNLDVRSNERPLHSRVIRYHGIEKTSETLDWLLSTYNFGNIKEIADNSSRY